MIIDAHCDTLEKWTDGNKNTHFQKNDIKGNYIQIFALFCSEEKKWERVNSLLDTFDSSDLGKKIYSKSDLESGFSFGSLLSLEGADFLSEDMGRIDTLFERGVRMLSLTWNHSNLLAGSSLEKDLGLTSLGLKVLKRAEEKGMTIDLSHIGEKSFYDVLENACTSVVLSHSNSKKICNHKRNITDEQFLAVMKNKGCVGINFYPPFLREDERASMDDIIKHIDHFLSLGGEDNIGIGTDFDGIGFLPDDVTGTKSLYTLSDRLDYFYGEKITKKIMGENFFRVLKGNLF